MGLYNQRTAENKATQVRNEGVEKEGDIRRAAAELLSHQNAEFGAKDIVTTSGSAGQIKGDTVQLGEVDALTERENYRLEAQAIEDQAQNDLWAVNVEADQTRYTGQSALVGGAIGAGTAVVNSKWYTSKSAASQLSKTPTYNINSSSSLNTQRMAV